MNSNYRVAAIVFLLILASVLAFIWTHYAPSAGDVSPGIRGRNL